MSSVVLSPYVHKVCFHALIAELISRWLRFSRYGFAFGEIGDRQDQAAHGDRERLLVCKIT